MKGERGEVTWPNGTGQDAKLRAGVEARQAKPHAIASRSHRQSCTNQLPRFQPGGQLIAKGRRAMPSLMGSVRMLPCHSYRYGHAQCYRCGGTTLWQRAAHQGAQLGGNAASGRVKTLRFTFSLRYTQSRRNYFICCGLCLRPLGAAMHGARRATHRSNRRPGCLRPRQATSRSLNATRKGSST